MINLSLILMATDFSAYSKEALGHAVYLAKAFKSDLYLIHVFESPFYVFEPPFYFHSGASPSTQSEIYQYINEAREEARRMLNTLANDIQYREERVHTLFKEGIPFLEVLKAAGEIQANLIVLGTHGHTGLAHVLMGSVTERVVQKSPCPVFTVRPRALTIPTEENV